MGHMIARLHVFVHALSRMEHPVTWWVTGVEGDKFMGEDLGLFCEAQKA